MLIVGRGLSELGGVSSPDEMSGQDLRNSGRPNRDRGNLGPIPIPRMRSDSEMHTLGYKFRPWRDRKAIAGGASIREYIEETAQEYGIDPKIRFGHQVTQASWSCAKQPGRSTRRVPKGKPPGSPATFFACAAATRLAEGYMPGWPGMERYQGPSCTRRAGPRISTSTASELW